jgi:hypothetical protein
LSNFGRALAAALAIGVGMVVGPSVSSSRPVLAAGGPPSIGDPRYFAGVNLPWFNWGCDFGCGKNGGVQAAAVHSALSDRFASLKSANVHTVRWWTFEGDASQITRDSSGTPQTLKPDVYSDFDSALALAEQYDLAFDFVLFSAPSALPRAWISNTAKRQQLASVLGPLFERYKNHPRILAWEFFNEPEYDIWGNKVTSADVQATVKLLASTVHAHSSTPVTVGSATLEGIPLWMGLGLDFYSPHWYDHMSSGLQCARCSDVASIRSTGNFDGLPIVLGEFEGGPDTDTLQRLNDFRAKGYAGAWAWSLFTEKTSDGLRVDLGAISKFDPDYVAIPAGPAAAVSASPSTVQLRANWVSPTYSLPGQQITINQDVLSSSDASLLLDFELYNDKGQQIAQTSIDNLTVSANLLASFSADITLPASLPAGSYTAKTGAFAPGGGTLYAWSDWAGTVVVQAPPPTPTPSPVPTPEPSAPDTTDSNGV